MTAHVTALWRYPVKGFSPEVLDAVDLRAGETMPLDRAFAIENGPSGFDAAAPAHLPKQKFLCLARNAELAKFETRYDEASSLFAIREAGRTLVEGRLDDPAERTAIEAFLAERLGDALAGRPRILAAPGHSFSDVAKKVLHLVNRVTVRRMERQLGVAVDPLRFPPHVIADGL